MNISFFENGQYVLGVDYSKREDCTLVHQISQEDADKISMGCSVKVEEGEVVIIEGANYKDRVKKEKLDAIEKVMLDINTKKKALQDLIDANLNTEHDLIVVEELQKQLEVMASERKAILEA